MNYLFKTVTFEYLQLVVQYFQFYPLFELGNPTIFYFLFYSVAIKLFFNIF